MIETTKGWDLQLLRAEDVEDYIPVDKTLHTLWKTTQKETSERNNIEVKYNGHGKQNYVAH